MAVEGGAVAVEGGAVAVKSASIPRASPISGRRGLTAGRAVTIERCVMGSSRTSCVSA